MGRGSYDIAKEQASRNKHGLRPPNFTRAVIMFICMKKDTASPL